MTSSGQVEKDQKEVKEIKELREFKKKLEENEQQQAELKYFLPPLPPPISRSPFILSIGWAFP